MNQPRKTAPPDQRGGDQLGRAHALGPAEHKRGQQRQQGRHSQWRRGICQQPIRPSRNRPQIGQRFARGRQNASIRGLSGQGQHQAGHDGPQIARRRQNQQPAGAAARQDHPGAEHQSAYDSPRQAARSGDLTRRTYIQVPRKDRQLHQRQRGGESNQPDRQFRAEPAFGDFDRCRAQAKTRVTRRGAEHQPDQGPRDHQEPWFSELFNQLFHQGPPASCFRDTLSRLRSTCLDLAQVRSATIG